MTIINNILAADEGKTLKKGDAIAKIVHLGINDNASNWVEIEEVQEQIPAEEALDIITGG